MATDSSKRFLSTHEAAELLGYTHDYISKMCREGKLEGIRLGRSWVIDPEVLEAFKAKHEAHLSNYRETASLRARGVPVPLPVVSAVPRPEPVVYEPVREENIFEPVPSPFFTRIPRSLAVVPLALMIVVGSAFAYTNLEKITSQGSGREFANTASAVASNFGESLALFTYETIQSFFNTTEKVVASLFAPREQAVVVEDVVKEESESSVVVTAEPAPAVATTTRVVVASEPAPIYRYGDSYYNEYYTVTSTGVSAEYVEERIKLHIDNLDERIDNRLDDVRENSGGGGGGGSGSVTSVDVSGGSTGLSFSGGPVTSSGTLTMSGMLAIANGGTGTSTAPTYGQLLLGNALGGYDLVATSSLGITGGSSFSYLFPSNATTTSIAFNGGLTASAFTLGTLNGPLHANNGVVSATTSIGVLYGGTGLTSVPSYGNILVGNSSGGYTLTATSSLGLQSQLEGTQGQVAYFNDTNQAVGTSSLFIATSGNVGLGTAVPNYNLDIGGVGAILNIGTTGSGAPSLYMRATEILTYTAGIGRMPNGLMVGPSNTIDATYRIQINGSSGNNGIIVRNNGTYNVLRVDGGAVNIDTLGNAQFLGRLGIGTTSPYAKASIHANNGDTNTTLFAIGSSTASATTTLLSVNNKGAVLLSSALSSGNSAPPKGAGYIGTENTTNTGLYFSSNDRISFQVTNGDMASYTSTGFVAGPSQSFGWSSNQYPGYQAIARDTSLSRLSAGFVGVGNGTAGNITGTLALERIGLGTTTPYAQLAIVATSTSGVGAPTTLFAIASTTGGTATSTLFSISNTGAVSSGPITATSLTVGTNSITSGGGYDNFSASNQLRIYGYNVTLFSNGSERMKISDTGNVGIGTTSPYAKLSVVGPVVAEYFHATSSTATSIFGGNFQLPLLGTATGSFIAVDANGQVIATTTPSFSLTGTTGQVAYFSGTNTAVGTSSLSIAPNGNVGIGSTSPSQRLVVASSDGRYTTSSGLSLLIKYNDNANNTLLTLENTEDSGTFGTYFDFNLGYGGGSTFAGTAVRGARILVNEEAQWTSTASTQDSYMAFFTALNGSTAEKVRIDSNGNVGIGSTSPLRTLSLSSSGTIGFGNDSSFVRTQACGSTCKGFDFVFPAGGVFRPVEASVKGTNDVFFQAVPATTSGYGLLEAYLSAGLVVGTGGNTSPVIFQVNRSEVGRFNTGGNFGVGTSSPFAKSSIHANNGETNTTLFAIGSSTASATTTLFSVLNAGNVGIGTASPLARLQVVAGNNTDIGLVVSGASGSQSGDLLRLEESNGGNRRVTVLASGRVGIGASTPLTFLQVEGNSASSAFGDSTISNQGIAVVNSNGGSGLPFGIQFGHVASKSFAGIYGLGNSSANNTTGDVAIATRAIATDNNFTERVRITSAGNVGIGTSTPYSKLSVWGGGTGTGGLFSLVNSASTTLMQVLDIGYVGIGTTNPAGPLDVKNPSTGLTHLFISNQTGVVRIGMGTSSPYTSNIGGGHVLTIGRGGNTGAENSSTLELTGADSAGYIVFRGNATNYGVISGERNLNITDGGIRFSTANAGTLGERMRIGHTGNVGIGSTSPFSKLSVHANNGETNTALFAIGSSTASATTTLFSVLNTGNVGIGTTTPSALLSVSGGDAVPLTRLFSSGDGGKTLDLSYSSVTDDWIFSADDARDYSFKINGNTTLNVDQGLVTMGNLTDGGGLYIQSNTDNSAVSPEANTGIKLINESQVANSYTSLMLGGSSTTGNDAWFVNSYYRANNDMDLQIGHRYSSESAYVPVLHLDTNNNVGIGSTSPFAKSSIHANNGETNTTLFAIGSSTASATTTLFSVSNSGAVTSAGGVTANGYGFVGQAVPSIFAGSGPYIGFSVFGTKFTINSSGSKLASDGFLAWSATTDANGTADVSISRLGANKLTLGNGTLIGESIGLGTTTPYAQLSIVATSTNGVGAPTTLFAIASTTAGTATTTLFEVRNGGGVYVRTGAGTNGYAFRGSDSGTLLFTNVSNNFSNNFQLFTSGGITLTSGGQYGWSSSGLGDTTTPDTVVFRAAANTVGVGTYAGVGQAARLTGTFAAERIGLGTSTPYAQLSIVATSTNGVGAPTTLFAIASTTAGTATSTLFMVNNNGNVGIGTTTPDGKLHISGIGESTFIIESDTDNTNTFEIPSVILRQNGTGLYSGMGLVGTNGATSVGAGVLLGPGAIQDALAINAASGVLQLATGANIRATINSSGNFGLGSTSPFSKLSVHANNGETNTTLFAIASSTASATTTLFSVNNMGQALFADGSNTSPSLSFASETGLGFFRRTTNIIQVGRSTAAIAEFVTSGSGSGLSLGGANTIGWNNTTVGLSSRDTFMRRVAAGVVGVGATDVIGNITGSLVAERIGLGTTSPYAQLSIVATSTNGLGAPTTLFAIASTTGGTATSTLFSVTNTGNIGIGTANPQAIFDVVGAVRFGGSTSDYSEFGNNGISNYWSSVTDPASIFTGGSERLRVDTSGNVGIGTTTPSYKLDVAGNTRIGWSANPSLTLTGFKSGGNEWFIQSVDADGRFRVYDQTSNAERITILQSGNVGIGTSTPTSNLSVSDRTANPNGTLFTQLTLATGQNLISGTAGGGNLIGFEMFGGGIATGAIGGYMAGTSNYGIGTWAGTNSGAPHMFVNNSGNVGIGTTTPTQKLEVGDGLGLEFLRVNGGTGTSEGSGIVFGQNSSNSLSIGNASAILGGSYSSDFVYYNGNSSAHRFYTTGSERVRIESSGNMGVGSTSPWRTLSVSGTASFAGLSTGAGAGALCLSANNEVLYNAGASCTVSSARFKNDIEDSELGLEAVLALRPVSYFYNDEVGVEGEQLGFIAEEVEDIDARLVVLDANGKPFTVKYDQMTAVLAKAIQELNIDLQSLASTSPLTAEEDSFVARVFENITSWMADTANGIGDFVANRVRTTELCVKDDTGETCLTRAQLDALLAGVGATQAEEPEEVGGEGEEPPAEETPIEEPPTEEMPTEEPPAEEVPTEEPPIEEATAEEPPAEEVATENSGGEENI